MGWGVKQSLILMCSGCVCVIGLGKRAKRFYMYFRTSRIVMGDDGSSCCCLICCFVLNLVGFRHHLVWFGQGSSPKLSLKSPSLDVKGKSDLKLVAPKPVVVLSSNSQKPRGGAKKLGAKKLGTKTCGAKKIESSGFGGASAMNDFDNVAAAAALSASNAEKNNSGTVESGIDQIEADRIIAEKLQREEDNPAMYRLVFLYIVIALIYNNISLLISFFFLCIIFSPTTAQIP